MNVLVVGTSGGIVSGITTAADQTVRTLEEQGIHVDRVSAGSRRRTRPSRLNLENVAAVLSDAWLVFRRARMMGADVVWYHTFGVPTLPALRALAIVLAARAAGARAVVRLHPYGFDDWLDQGGRPLRLTIRLLDWVASALVVEFESAAVALRNRTGARRVETLSNWVDVPVEPAPFPPMPPFTLVFVGGLIVRKGIYELLAAVRLIPDLEVRAHLVGSADEDGATAEVELRRAARDLISAGRVVFRGELSQDEVREEMRAGHLFVLPTRAEGLPLALLEAMAEGRPVVVGDAGGIRRIVESADAGLVLSTTSPTEIADAIRRFASDLVSLEDFGKRGHAYVRGEQLQAEALLQTLIASACRIREA